jgi:AMMECR1 domain-containing protein
LHDPRFEVDRLRLEELPNTEIELSLLSPLTPAADVLDFDPLHQGIYLKCGPRSGCFLPQVARETGWSREQLLSRLCTEKMGLPPDAWQDKDATLQVFSTLVIGPEGFGEDGIRDE